MKWQDVRELFPNQFVLVSILEYREEGNRKVVDEVHRLGLFLIKMLKKYFSMPRKELVFIILLMKNLLLTFEENH
ncbi:hypothetical protein [Sutcliffiella sp. NC1]|uniref:hypothetical protein n=1 Tax=Sutcliffiella sp. NC1 TaxID=3004096 RepID=UPI003FCDE746